MESELPQGIGCCVRGQRRPVEKKRQKERLVAIVQDPDLTTTDPSSEERPRGRRGPRCRHCQSKLLIGEGVNKTQLSAA